MKNTPFYRRISLALIVAGLLVSGASVIGKPNVRTKKDKEIIELLQQGLPVEMPLRAATIVKDAPAAERKIVAVQVINRGIELRPQLAAAFVSAIVKVAPETANDVVAAASKAEPAQRQAIVAAVPRTVATPSSSSAAKVSALSSPNPGGPFVAQQEKVVLDDNKSKKAEGSNKTSNGAVLDQNPPNTIITPGGNVIEITRKPGFPPGGGRPPGRPPGQPPVQPPPPGQ
ncbi:MAG: hypothetical protein ACO1QB_10340 [Verrucomicrobiales bacterium]